MLSSEDRAEIQARADAATEGPWIDWHSNMDDADGNHIPDDEMDPEDYEPFYCPPATGAFLISAHPREEQVANAEFIAHARTDIPKLLAELTRIEQALEREGLASALQSTGGIEGAIDSGFIADAIRTHLLGDNEGKTT